MTLEEVTPGLRRWTAWHDEWLEDVGCLAVDTRDGLVVVDPLDPPRGLGRPAHVLLGAGAKPRDTGAPVRLCPERRLGEATHDDLRESLVPLLDLPVARVLVSHGEPVLRGGARALADALAG